MPSLDDHTPLHRAILDADLPVHGRMLLAVSGGADSVALLHAVLAVVRSGHRDWEVGVAHINHSLRGAQSDEDEQFVGALAQREGLPHWSERVDTAGHARRQHQSLETAARELRYAALLRILRAWDGDAVLTGHTQDDQAETVLMRLLRGAGLRGLGAMRPRNGPVVRPFLGVRRVQILEFLQSSGLGYRVDPTNADPIHTRNRLRRDVVPLLDLLQPRLVPVLARTAEALQRDSDFVFLQAEEALQLMDVRQSEHSCSASQAVWRSLHPSLRQATLVLLLERLKRAPAEVTHDQLRALATALELERPTQVPPAAISLSMEGDRFDLSSRTVPSPERLADTELPVPGVIHTPAGTVTAQLLDHSEEMPFLLAVGGRLHALCDADQMRGPLTVGSRRPGDRVAPLGGPGSRKLQDIFVDRKVPRRLRDRIPVIRDATGIVWIGGMILDSRVAVWPETRRILHIRWDPAAGIPW